MRCRMVYYNSRTAEVIKSTVSGIVAMILSTE